MREYSFALGTVASTFALLVIGGLVHATGSSLACPDWPLCYGQLFPEMREGVLFEHGHRLAAAAVASLTVALAVMVWRARHERLLRGLAVLAVLLVLVQAVLGGVTVILKLPLLVSSAHLATSMAFFSTLIYLAHRLRPADLPRGAPGPRALVGAAALLVYGQIVLGAFVRHTGSALACGNRIPLCRDVLWPAGSGPAQLHMAHRLAGVAISVLVVIAVIGPARRALRGGDRHRALLALVAPALVLAQVGLGFWTVVSGVSIHVVTAHLATGALLLADLLALFLSLGPVPAAAERARQGASRRLATA
jgi:heme A synthase